MSDEIVMVIVKNHSPAVQSIISQLTLQETWEEFLAYRLLKGRFNWHEFDEADAFVEREDYLPLAKKIAEGEEKVAKITMRNEHGVRILNYTLSRRGTHDDGTKGI